jgi:hypothetical protein
MRIGIDPSGLLETRWYEFAVRFLIGGFITAATGIIARQWGPVVGGLFLAFPAIFPASATLIEKHEKDRKKKVGLHGAERGRKAASVDAAGAAIGSLGLFAFAFLVSRMLIAHSPVLVLVLSTASWLSVSLFGWYLRKRI